MTGRIINNLIEVRQGDSYPINIEVKQGGKPVYLTGATMTMQVRDSNNSVVFTLNGTAVSRTTYANLFAVIGISYGTGDGINTFNLPDFRDRTVFMRNDKAVGKTSLGSIPDHRHKSWGTSGSTGWTGGGANNGLYDTTYASEDTSLFGTSLYSKTVNKVIPSHASCNFIIRY